MFRRSDFLIFLILFVAWTIADSMQFPLSEETVTFTRYRCLNIFFLLTIMGN
jgi:hypothetical protein